MKKLLFVLSILIFTTTARADMRGDLTFNYDDQSVPELAMVQLEVLLDGQPSCVFDTEGYRPGDSFSTNCIPEGDISPGEHEFSFRATLADGSYTYGDMLAMGTIPRPSPPVVIPEANPLEVIEFTVTVNYPDEDEQVVETELVEP